MYTTCYVTNKVPVAPIITGITLVFTVHMPYIYIVRSAYSRISSASFLITFLSSPEIATVCYQTLSIVIITDFKYVAPFIVRDGSAGLHLSSPQCSYLTSRTGFCWFWNMITPLLTGLFTPLPCTHTLSCLFMDCSVASTGHSDAMWSTASSNCWHNPHLLFVSVCNIFVTWYFVCNAWSCAATISQYVSDYYLLTPWCRVLLEKLTGLQLVKKSPTFHGTRRFITALTSVRHLSLSWARPIQSIYPHPTSWRYVSDYYYYYYYVSYMFCPLSFVISVCILCCFCYGPLGCWLGRLIIKIIKFNWIIIGNAALVFP